MPTQYRIEISPNNRAICKDTECKKRSEKITKGTTRFGVWVEIQDHGSWAWKHWGCVSGSQLVNLQDICDQGNGDFDFDAIDGYDELNDHPDIQEKIRRCVKQGHIDPEDFNGDPEKNIPGAKGIHLTAKQKEKKEQEAQALASPESPGDEKPAAKTKKATAKKRGITKADRDEEDEPQPKKAKKGQSSKRSKAVKEEEDDGLPPVKPSRGHKSSTKKTKEESSEQEAVEEPVAAKHKRKAAGSAKAKGSGQKSEVSAPPKKAAVGSKPGAKEKTGAKASSASTEEPKRRRSRNSRKS